MMGVVLAALACWPATARVLEVGPGRAFEKPSAAAAAAGPGDTIRISKGEFFDCMTLRAPGISVEGAGPDTVLTDAVCAGKALIIAAADNITVRDLTLTRARVPDGNGAGIRAEGGNLLVERVRFVDNQDGILSAPLPGSTITVRDSLFDRNGACISQCAHGIYAAALALLHVERSRFIGTRQGHGIKSRAARTEVVDCEITDGPDGTSSYLIELPNGGALLARGNTLEKGPRSENHSAAIAIGMEGVNQPTRDVVVENNVFRNDGSYPTSLVTNVSAADAQVRGNRISGQARPLVGDGTVR